MAAIIGDSRANRPFFDWTGNAGADPGPSAAPWDAGSGSTPASTWPVFEFVNDLRTGSILDVRSLAAASLPALTDAPDTAEPEIEQIVSWAYHFGSSPYPESASNPKLASAGGSAASSSPMAKLPQEERESSTGQAAGSVKMPAEADLDNWPPAGWNGFDKSDVAASAPGSVARASAQTAGFVDDSVHYATKLIGTSGDDVINGTTGNDFFNGLGGDDVLNGGPGDDAFLFMAGFGQDVVLGFTAGDGGDDVIEFRGMFSSFADVQAASRQVGRNVIIEVDDDNGVALIDVALASLNQDDFRFV